MKNGFVLYKTQYEPIRCLSLIQKGMLLDRIFLFELGEDNPSNDAIVEMAFNFFRSQLTMDREKYEETIVKRNQFNGSKGGRPSKNPKNPVGLKKPKKPVNVNDNVNDNVNVKENIYFDNIDVNKTFLDYLDMRIQIKKKATQTAINNKIKFLNNYRDDIKIKILNKSIDNNWTDLYELKPEQQPYNKNKPPGLVEGNQTKIWKPQEYKSKIPLSLKDIE